MSRMGGWERNFPTRPVGLGSHGRGLVDAMGHGDRPAAARPPSRRRQRDDRRQPSAQGSRTPRRGYEGGPAHPSARASTTAGAPAVSASAPVPRVSPSPEPPCGRRTNARAAGGSCPHGLEHLASRPARPVVRGPAVQTASPGTSTYSFRRTSRTGWSAGSSVSSMRPTARTPMAALVAKAACMALTSDSANRAVRCS